MPKVYKLIFVNKSKSFVTLDEYQMGGSQLAVSKTFQSVILVCRVWALVSIIVCICSFILHCLIHQYNQRKVLYPSHQKQKYSFLPNGLPHLEQKLSVFFHCSKDQPLLSVCAVLTSTRKSPALRSVNLALFSTSISAALSCWLSKKI